MKCFLKILTISLFIISCNSPSEDLEVNGSDLQLEIARFDQDLFEWKEETDINTLKEKYPVLFGIYVESIIGVSAPDDPAVGYYLNLFREDGQIREIKKKTAEVYPDLTTIEQDFAKAFKRYEHAFPNLVVPRVVSFISGFSYTIVVDDSLLAIGLDMYLGSDCDFYPRLGIPKYKFLNMDKSNLVADCMKAWISTEYEPSKEENNLLSAMIYQGKLAYALDRLLPGTADPIKLGYSPAQFNWCIENEVEVWAHFINRELLYQQENNVLSKYMNESPFTPGFPEGSPGQIGKWVGWQIVKKYMEQQPETTLQELFENELSAAQILQESNYKPKR